MADRILRPQCFDVDPHSSDAADKWTHWRKTFENFLNSIQSLEVDPFATLINYISSSVYRHISDLKSYDASINALQSLYVQPKNAIFARHVLSTAKQESGQSSSEFVQKLKCLSSDCEFQAVSAETYREESIRDAFIRGLLSSSIRQRLLEQKSLTLQSAVDLARQLDVAQQQSSSYGRDPNFACSIDRSQPAAAEHSCADQQNPTAAVTATSCYFCGSSRHPRSKCPARDVYCKSCGKKGHFQRVCRASKVNNINSDTPNTPSQLFSLLVAATPDSLSKAVVPVFLGDNKLCALIDTGSSESYVSKSTVRRLNLSVYNSCKKVTMASTHLSSCTLGHCVVSLCINSTHYDQIKLSILPDLCTDILLGHDFLSLHASVEISFSGSKPPLSLCNLTALSITPPLLFKHLSPDCKPIATKSRRFSEPDKLFIKNEVGRLLRQGIIEPSDSPWRAQVLVTHNERHKRRMVVDYSQTINRFTYLDAYPLPRIDDIVSKIAQFEVYSTLDLTSVYHQIPISDDETIFTVFEADGRLF